MAESIALGMRLATADELATVAGIEGEISVTEGEWRAVVHDGVTKGGYPLAKLAEAGYSLTKSEDGTKLQLKNKNGVVLSETDGPAGSGGSDVDVSNLVPKTGDRGLLAGYSELNVVMDAAETVVIDANSPDDSFVSFSTSGGSSLVFMPGESGKTFVKQVLLMQGGLGSVSFYSEDNDLIAIFDSTFDAYYQASYIDLLIYVWYGDLGIIYTKQLM